MSKFGQNESIEDESLKDFLYLKKKKKKSLVKRKKVAKKFNNKGFKAAQGPVTLAKPKKKEKWEGWSKPQKYPNQDDIKKLFGAALEILILAVMRGHLYQFKGKFRLQREKLDIPSRELFFPLV